MNKAILEGHLGADPRNNITTVNQKPVCNFRMATNSSWKDAAGVKHEKSEWHNVVCWNALAITVGEHMRKGSHVLVDGRIETRSYETQHVDPATKQPVFLASGQPLMITRYATEIVARTVTFLDKKPETAAYVQPGAVVGQAPVVAAAAPGTVFVMNGQPVGSTVVGQQAAVVPQPGTVVHPTTNGAPIMVAGDPNAVAAAIPAAVDPAQTVQPVVIAGV